MAASGPYSGYSQPSKRYAFVASATVNAVVTTESVQVLTVILCNVSGAEVTCKMTDTAGSIFKLFNERITPGETKPVPLLLAQFTGIKFWASIGSALHVTIEGYPGA